MGKSVTIEGIEPDTLMSLANSVSVMCCLFYEQCVRVNPLTGESIRNSLRDYLYNEELLDLLLVNYFCSY